MYAQGSKDLAMSFGEVFVLISLATLINMLILVIPVDFRSSEPQDMVLVFMIFLILLHSRLRTKKGIWSVYVIVLPL